MDDLLFLTFSARVSSFIYYSFVLRSQISHDNYIYYINCDVYKKQRNNQYCLLNIISRWICMKIYNLFF